MRTFTREQVAKVVENYRNALISDPCVGKIDCHLMMTAADEVLRRLDALPNPPAVPESATREDPRAATLEDFRNGVGQRPSPPCAKCGAPTRRGYILCDACPDPISQRPRATPVPSVPALKAERATHGGYHGPRAVRQAIQYAPPGVQVDAFRALGALAADHMRLRQQANVAESMHALSLETADAVPSTPAAGHREYPRLVDAVRQALAQLRDGRVGDAIATLSTALTGEAPAP